MARRGENIRRRKDGRWEARLLCGRSEDGKPQYKSFYGKTYKEAKEKMTSAAREPIPGEGSPAERTVREVTEYWFAQNSTHWKASTAEKYRAILEQHICPNLGDVKLSELTSARVQLFLSQQLSTGRLDGAGGLSASLVRTMATVLRAALQYGAEEKFSREVVLRIRKPQPEKVGTEALTLEQQNRIETALLESDHPGDLGILLSLRLGLRLGEVCALQWDNIDLERGLLQVRNTLSRVCGDTSGTLWHIEKPKTASSLRTIPLSSSLITLLHRAKEKSRSEYVISNGVGFASPRTLEYRFQRILKRCGLAHYKFHVLRHTFATRCVEAGVDIKSLSEVLGHASTSMTLNVYVHSTFEQKRLQLEKLPQLPECYSGSSFGSENFTQAAAL